MKEIAAVLIIILIAASSPARIITVDDDGPADFTAIQAAIDDANDGDIVEIQPGTYTGPGNRDIDFFGKAITVRSTDPNDPNTVAETIIDSEGEERALVFQSGEDANSVLDGLTITGGYPAILIEDSAPTIKNCTITDNLGGVHCYSDGNGNPTISHCLFTRNSSHSYNGAITFVGSISTVSHCVFRDNDAVYHWGQGGAVAVYCNRGYVVLESDITFVNCLFTDCSAAVGGGVYVRESSATFNNCLFDRCSARHGAGLGVMMGNVILINCQFNGNSYNIRYAFSNRPRGALSSELSNLTLINCLFTGNYVLDAGALAIWDSDVSIDNCTFADNYAIQGNSLVFGSGRFDDDFISRIHIANSIVWDGADSIGVDEETILLVNFSDVQGRIPGYRNIDVDPCFVDPGRWVDSRDPNIIVEPDHDYAVWVNGDYHLKSQAGRWDANEGLWTTDEATSPCIDAGDPNTPIGQEPFPNGGRINMGVYGGTAEASKSYFGKPLCETIVAGDINGDCVVNGLDFSLMAAHWLGQRICPDQPSEPNPANNAADVPITQLLTWRPSCDATSYKVYFGTTSPGQYRGQQEIVLFDPGTLEYNTTYYWHIRDVTPYGTIVGPTWTFQTPFRRDPASNPDPYDGQTGISTYPTLTWTAGIGAESHDVYLGTDYAVVGYADRDSSEYKGNQSATIFNPGPLSLATTYYWRIDEVVLNGQTTMGQIWQFTTYSRPPR